MKEYSWVEEFDSGLARVSYNERYSIIDENFNEICECKYHYIGIFNCFDLAIIEYYGYFGYINKHGIEVIPCIYKWCELGDAAFKYILNQNRIEKLKTLV